MHDQQPSGFDDRIENGIEVDRGQRGHVDDLAADGLAGELLGGLQTLHRHRAPGDDGQVAPLAQHKTTVQRQRPAVVFDLLAREAIQPYRFEENHRIGSADRGQQQPIGARRGGGTQYPQPRMMAQQRLQALGVMFGRMNAAAVRHAQHQRTGQPAARAVAQPRHVARDLVDRRINETHELDLGHRLDALGRQPDRRAGDQAFGQGSVLYSRGAKTLLQSDRGAKDPAIGAHILPEHHHRRVVLHLPGMRHVDGLDHRHLRHRVPLMPGCTVRLAAQRSGGPGHAAPADAAAARRTGNQTWRRSIAWVWPGSDGPRRRPARRARA